MRCRMQQLRSRVIWCALLVALLLLGADDSRADSPKVDALFPCGGQTGQTVALEAIGKADRWPLQVWSSCEQIAVSPAEEKGHFTATIAADAPMGLHWIRLYDAQGTTQPLPFVVGALSETNEQEPNNDPLHPQTLTEEPLVVNGRLERSGDVDHFAVALKQGATLVASIDSHRLGSALDATLQIVSGDGFVLSHNDDDQGLDPRVVFVAPRDGTYVVRVFGFPADPNASIALAGGTKYYYRLTVTTQGFLDYALPLALQADHPSTVELYGWNLPSETRQLSAAASGNAMSYAVSIPGLAGHLTLPVESHRCTIESEPNPRDAAQPLEVPITMTGRIYPPGDEDYYQFAAADKQQFSFAIESRGLGYPLDPVLEVLDAEGKSLARVDDVGAARDALLDFTAPAPGHYTLRVTDLHRTGSDRHIYRLRATPTQPTYRLTVASDQFATTAGSTLEIPVSIERLHGFAQQIDFTIEGLPPSSTYDPATSASEGDTSTSVTLKLTAGDAPFAGPIRIVGRVAASETSPQIATIAGRSQPDPGLWLTISAANE